MIKSTLFNSRQVNLKLVDDVVYRHVVGNRTNDNPGALDDGHFAVFEVNHLFSGVDEWRCVAADKELVVAKAEDKG